jgi:DNA-binding NarL/FixJ family response regulator
MKNKIRVMLVEDHVGYREVITRALKRESGVELISQFGTAEIALRSVQDNPSEQVPDIVLLDLNLPGLSGLESIPWFKKYVPQTKILIISQSDSEADILSAISLGAAGYLLKSATVKQISDGIRTVIDGGASLDPKVAKLVLNRLKNRSPKPSQKKALSERELEILTLIGEGLVKKEIAERLAISITTVAYHVKHIYEKLNVVNAPAAVSKGYLSDILPAGK